MASNKDRAKYVRRTQLRELEIELRDSFAWLYGLNDKLAEGLIPKIGDGTFKDLDKLLGRYRSFENPTLGMQFMYTGISTLYGEVRKYYDKPNQISKSREELLGLSLSA